MYQASFDLQSHSTHSDGELEPAHVVAAAAQAGVELLALTDHDSTDGVQEAALAAGRHGLSLLPAVEISTIDPAGGDLHICGYAINLASADLQARLTRSREDRLRRAQRMVQALTDLGWAIDQRLLEARAAAGMTIGRPHLAHAVVSHPDNAQRLVDEGLGDATAFLVAYLIEGRPAFSERDAPTVAEAVGLIHAAGGLAVWAHPFWDVPEAEEVLATLERFLGYGLDGVEAFYVTHTEQQTRLLVARCGELGLLTTGSSDFHGPRHRQFDRFRAFATYGLTANLGPLAHRQ
ncbi:MAG: PHP domain-containing protein [Solirubrobacteraceae bacterium]